MYRNINVTIKMHEQEIYSFEQWLKMNVDVKDFRIIQDDKNMYKEDDVYKKLCDAVKKAKEIKQKYYNDKRFLYI